MVFLRLSRSLRALSSRTSFAPTLGRRTALGTLGLGAFAGVGGALARPASCQAAADGPLESIKAATSDPSLLGKCVAEAVGTAFIVLGGCGVVCAAKYAGSGMGAFGLAATWGISVALAVYATREISGAHLNPAVTVALVANGMAPLGEAPWYIGAQMVGATLAGFINYFVFAAGIAALEASQQVVRGTAASTAIYHGAFGMVPTVALVGPFGAFVCEVWMTAVLAFMIFAFTDEDNTMPTDAAPLAIGATVATLIATFGPVTGCGMNPARDLGPRLVTLFTGWGGAALSCWWVYTLGPVLGAVLGGTLYTEFFSAPLKGKAEAKAKAEARARAKAFRADLAFAQRPPPKGKAKDAA